MFGKASQIKLNDLWIYHGVTYTVERDEDGDLYFKHPDERSTEDDHILIENVSLGEIIYKEESA